MTRGFGDRAYKPFISQEPDITIYKRKNTDKYLLLATDGLWDVIFYNYFNFCMSRKYQGE